jgi:hypothetical protein
MFSGSSTRPVDPAFTAARQDALVTLGFGERLAERLVSGHRRAGVLDGAACAQFREHVLVALMELEFLEESFGVRAFVAG